MQRRLTTPTGPLRLLAPALLVAASALATACGDGGTGAATAPAPERPTTTITEPARVPGPTSVPSPPEVVPVTAPAETEASTPPPPPTTVPAQLEDGRHFGYLVGYEPGSSATAASFDLAQLLTGDEADRAAAEDAAIEPGGQVENDVWVRNVNDRLRRALFRDDARITVIDCTAGCRSVQADRATLQNRPVPTPVHLTVEGGVVVSAEEVYLP